MDDLGLFEYGVELFLRFLPPLLVWIVEIRPNGPSISIEIEPHLDGVGCPNVIECDVNDFRIIVGPRVEQVDLDGVWTHHVRVQTLLELSDQEEDIGAELVRPLDGFHRLPDISERFFH